MKHSLLCLIVLFMFTGTGIAFDDSPQIRVTGTGTIEVVPDEMYWTLRVENHGPQIKALAKDHSDIISNLIETLEKTEILKDDIQTTRMQLGERWDHKNGHRIRAGFFAASTISFKLIDFQKYQTLWQELAGFKGMNIQNVTYGVSKKIAIQDKARTLAVTAAEKKARAMAATLKCDIGLPLFMEEIQGKHEMYRSNMVMADSGGFAGAPQAGKSYAPGIVKVESRVNAAFSLKCKKGN